MSTGVITIEIDPSTPVTRQRRILKRRGSYEGEEMTLNGTHMIQFHFPHWPLDAVEDNRGTKWSLHQRTDSEATGRDTLGGGVVRIICPSATKQAEEHR